jgi:hypothetical protein
VIEPLALPPQPIIANPPPPGVYAGPRLSVFAHVLAADGTLLKGDDGLWVDPWTLQPGDRFLQIHRFPGLEGAAPEPDHAAIGLYDPKTGARWQIRESGEDRILIPTLK